MRAEDLRIGNFVDLYKGNIYWGIERVSNLDMKGINQSFHSEYYAVFNDPYNDELLIKPIPLTEEWFTKFGYEHHTEALAELFDLSGEHLGFHLEIHADDWLAMWQSMYVHTFQNWWKSNTGEELTIKES